MFLNLQEGLWQYIEMMYKLFSEEKDLIYIKAYRQGQAIELIMNDFPGLLIFTNY